jgi:hypothetical protein
MTNQVSDQMITIKPPKQNILLTAGLYHFIISFGTEPKIQHISTTNLRLSQFNSINSSSSQSSREEKFYSLSRTKRGLAAAAAASFRCVRKIIGASNLPLCHVSPSA